MQNQTIKKLNGNFFEIKRPSTNLEHFNSFRGNEQGTLEVFNRVSNLSVENLHTPKEKAFVAIKCKDYFYDAE